MPPRRSIRDPRGRDVELTADRWRHIIQGHPELAAHEEEIMRAIEAPTEALPGRTPDEEWFYLRDAGPSRWLKVVVVFQPTSGRIIAAFPRRRKP